MYIFDGTCFSILVYADVLLPNKKKIIHFKYFTFKFFMCSLNIFDVPIQYLYVISYNSHQNTWMEN